MTGKKHLSTYGYDRSHRLTESGRTAGGLTVYSHAYDHDPNGNIISLDGDVRIVHPPTGRLTWNSGDGCIYDANGALVECADATRTLALEWDACGGRLERVLVDRVAGDETVAEYTYDYAGRRIGKRVCMGEGIAACPEGTGTGTKYLWSGDRLIAEMDGASDIKRVYTWLGVVPVMVTDYLTDIEGEPFERSWAVATDWRGAAVRAYDLYDGSVAWSAEYDDLGTATVAAGNTVMLNWRLAGQYWDAETGYHYNNQRYYDPKAGRYLSMDPIGYDGGSLNLYGYANGDPVNYIDFKGLVVQFGESCDVACQAAFDEAVNYLDSAGQAGPINTVKESSNIFTLNYVPGGGSDSQLGSEIDWDYKSGLLVPGGVQSPALGLLHEFAHADVKCGSSGYSKETQYSGGEEIWIIRNVETPAAFALGEPARADHTGTSIPVAGPTSHTSY